MTTCPACSAEILGRDRFCRQCGVSVVPSVTEFADTQRFAAATNVNETTRQFHSPPSYPVASYPEQAVTARPKLSQHKFFWLFVTILLLSSLALGVGIFAVEHRRDRRQQEEMEAKEINQRTLETAVQNALGFKHASISAAEFPDVQGIFVNSLMSDDSAAALAHMLAGDVLMELNNHAVRNETELEEALNSLQAGQEMPIKVYRDGEIMDGRIRLGNRNFPPLLPKVEERDQGFLGIKDSARRCCLPNTKRWGIEIIELHENGPADLFGLKPGDVITEFNGQFVRTPSEFNRRIRAAKPRSKVQIKFYRGNLEQTIEAVVGHRWEEKW